MRIFVLLFFLFNSCTYNELTPLNDVNLTCDSENPSFKECIKPIIVNNCEGCHRSNSNSGSLESYNDIIVYIDNGKLLDRVQRNENDLGFMPLGGSKLDDENINLLIKWKNNGAPNN